jgi:hypothetical protein
VSELLPPPAPTAARNGAGRRAHDLDDHELLERARNAANGADVDALYRGEHSYPSPSEADLALVNDLAFWTGPDPDRIDRMFRASGLMRPKWDDRRGDSTYGAQTIAKALAARTDFYEPRRRSVESETPPVVPAYEIAIDAKGKLALPDAPALDDPAAQCAWLTCAFGLDPHHPVRGGRRGGVRGPTGHAEIYRVDAPPIRFEPVTRLNTATRLVEALAWSMIATDSAVPGLKNEHCREISHVVRMLCSTTDLITEEQETAKIVGAFLQTAQPADREVTSRGTSAQRYEAAIALRRDADAVTGRLIGAPRYACDADTDEFLIAVGDLQDAARRYMGSSLAHGWLDARMDLLGWQRIVLDGHALSGRDGRKGPHAYLGVYRGHLPSSDGTDWPTK